MDPTNSTVCTVEVPRAEKRNVGTHELQIVALVAAPQVLAPEFRRHNLG